MIDLNLDENALLKQYRTAKDIEIQNLLGQYGSSLKDVRAMYPQITETVQKRQLTTAFPTQPLFFTPSEAQDMGLVLQEGWMLKMTPGDQGYTSSFITPEKWEITEGGQYISPTGETYSEADIAALLSMPTGGLTSEEMPTGPLTIENLTEEGKTAYGEYQTAGGQLDVTGWINLRENQQLETEQVFGKVFPNQDVSDLITYINDQPEAFLTDLRDIGRNQDTEALLKLVMPDITEADMSQLFMPEFAPAGATEPVGATEAATTVYGTVLGNLTQEIKDIANGMVGAFSDIVSTIFGNKPVGVSETTEKLRVAVRQIPQTTAEFALATVSVAASYWSKYVDRPWQFFILGQRLALETLLGRDNTDTQQTMAQMQTVWDKYGWASVFSDEANQVYQGYKARESVGGEFKRLPLTLPVEILEWLNPVYLIPIGDGAGWIAKGLTKVPVIGRFATEAAAGVQVIEKEVFAPVTRLTELGLQGVRKVGAGLGEALTKKLLNESEHLVTLMKLPESGALLQATLADNWMKRALQTVSKVPPVKTILEKTLGWRILTEREAVTVEDFVAHGAILKVEFTRMGRQSVFPVIAELRGIISNPVKFFGFSDRAESAMMLERLLPEFKGLAEAGTLEHIFTHPEMYSWANLDKGLQYVTKFHELNTEILNMLKKEGIAPENVMEGWWMHRVVEGKIKPTGELIEVTGKAGVGARSIGARASYEKHRAYATMAEGIADGIKYGENPEISIATYLQEAFKQVGDERFIQYVGQGLEALGKAGQTPSERLLGLFPELFEEIPTAEGRTLARKAVLRTEELADVNHFSDVINRAMRGETLPEGTLKAIERRFPEQGLKLRALVKGASTSEKGLRDVLAENQKVITQLTEALQRKETTAIEPLKAIPDTEKLTAVFSTMPQEDRLAFRSTITSQSEDIQKMLGEQADELAGIEEFLANDSVATYRGHVGKQETSLLSLLKGGKWPETVTVKQAEMLTMGAKVAPEVINKEGRVPWEYVTDELADHFGMSEQELINKIEQIGTMKVKVNDLRILIGEATNRKDSIGKILGVLDGVDVTPEVVARETAKIPVAEAGMPEAGLQTDIFGYQTPVYPAGKGKITQISMDEYEKLVELHKKAGLPVPDVAIKPKIEGVPGLEGETTISKVAYDVPPVKSAAEIMAEFESLKSEVKAMAETKKGAYWEARQAQSFAMEQAGQPSLGEGFIMQSFAGGKIYDREFIDAFNKFFGRQTGFPGLSVVGDVAGILRITKAALDLSAMAIQGMPAWGLAHAYMLADPQTGIKLMGSWYKALGYSIRAYFDPDSIFRWIAKNEDTVLQRVGFGASTIGSDYLRLEAQSGLGRLFAKLSIYQRAELSFSTATEIVRDEFWRILSTKALANGKGFELARFLDRITGIIDSRALGVPMTMKQLETSFIWFAPNYTRACLSVLADIFRGGYTGDMARKAIGGMIGAGAVYYAGMQYSMATLEGKSHEQAWDSVMQGFGVQTDPITGEVSWKPSAQFMSFKVGNYNFGIGGFWYGLVRLTGNIMNCINEVGGKERIDLIRILKNGSLNKVDNPFIYWWFSRASPLVGTGFELASGRDFLGYPIETPMDYLKYIATRFEPIWMEQGINWMIPGMARDYEIPEGAARAAVGVAELFGLRTFPESGWTQFYDKATEVLNGVPKDIFSKYFTQDELTKILDAQARGKLQWGNLPNALQTELLMMYPDLKDLYSTAQADSAIRSSGVWKAWTQRTDEEQTIYYNRGNDLMAQLRTGQIDTQALRDAWSNAGQNYGTMLDSLEKDPHYAEIYSYFASQAAKGNKYDWNIDLALADYQQVVFGEYTTPNGDYDFAAKDKAVDLYIERWGQETYDIIRQMYADKKIVAGLDQALVRMADDKDVLGRDYWNLPYKAIMDMTQDDYDQGNIPTQYSALWKTYQGMAEVDKSGFLALYPELSKDWRTEWRATHPEDDARLALWGYGGKLQSQAAYDLVIKWGQELNIPLDQMGLGLPPQSLITDYFDYNKLSAQVSGSSAEAKLFRLDHPEFDTWGQQTYGWKPIEGNPELFKLQVNYKDQFDLYNAYGNEKSPSYIESDRAREDAREAMLFSQDKMTSFGVASYTIDALQKNLPDNLVTTYVDYYGIRKKSGVDYSAGWYEDDWYLLEHKDFYNTMISLGLWQSRDFSKVPTREVYSLYQTYLGKATGTPRLDFRAQNKALDDWLVKAKGYTPVGDR